MLLKKKIKFMLIFSIILIILPMAYSQQTCTAAEIKDALRKALFEYFESPTSSKLSVNEIKDFLNFYISTDSSQLVVDCGGSGPLSGKPYYLMLGTARNIEKSIPKCGDGTDYGKCSTNAPNYCYGGKLEERCKICGCKGNEICDAKTNKCVTQSEPLQPTDFCKATTCDDKNVCTADSCDNGVCSRKPVANGTACGPSNICQNGYCVIDPASSCERVGFYKPLHQDEPLFDLRERRKEYTNLQIFPNILVLEDLDYDNDLDMIIHMWDFNVPTPYVDYLGYSTWGSTTFARIFFNDGNGKFKDSGQTIESGGKISVGDVDGDKDKDLIINVALTSGTDYSTYKNTLQTYLNDGKGNFKRGQLITDAHLNYRQTLADIDGDNDLDLVFINSTFWGLNPRTKIYLNDGKGNFNGAKDTGILDRSVYDYVVFDVDNDGDMDIVEVHNGDYVYSNFSMGWTYPNPILFVYSNDGKGKFSLIQKIKQPSAPYFSVPTSAYPIYFGDIDNDGDKDIIVKDYNQGATGGTTPRTAYDARFTTNPPDRVYRNDGKGVFTLDSKRIYIGYIGFDPSGPLIDVDDDEDFDVAMTGGGLLMLNDGTGAFTPYCMDPPPFISAFGDINSDGKTDVASIVYERGILVKTFLHK